MNKEKLEERITDMMILIEDRAKPIKEAGFDPYEAILMETSSMVCSLIDKEQALQEEVDRLREALPAILECIIGYALLQENSGVTDVELNPDVLEALYEKLQALEEE